VSLERLIAKVAGSASFIIFALSVIYGLYQSNQLYVRFRILDAQLSQNTHRFLSWFGLFLAIIHRQILDVANYGFGNILSAYGFHILLGNIALIGFFLIILSSEIRGKILPMSLWRAFHYLSFIGYIFVLFHAVALARSGTLNSIIYLSTAIPIALLTILRVLKSINLVKI
jgi:predicted ferric reductase